MGNLFTHAERISEAMTVRGFAGANQHRVYLMNQLSLGFVDVAMLALLGAFVYGVTTSDLY